MGEWIYYRIFLTDQRIGVYPQIVRELIAPLYREHHDKIEKIFFLRYFPTYDREPCESPLNISHPVQFIRLRIRADSSNIADIDGSLLSKLNAQKEAEKLIGWEKCNYDFEGDIGTRFGSICKLQVLDHLDATSRIMIEMVSGDEYNTPDGFRKIVDVMHLAGNTLDFSIVDKKILIGTLIGPEVDGFV